MSAQSRSEIVAIFLAVLELSKTRKIMIEETEKIRKAFLEAQIGKTLEVLPEEFHDGFVQGYTANYTPVRIFGADITKGIIKAEITSVEDDFCIGRKI